MWLYVNINVYVKRIIKQELKSKSANRKNVYKLMQVFDLMHSSFLVFMALCSNNKWFEKTKCTDFFL